VSKGFVSCRYHLVSKVGPAIGSTVSPHSNNSSRQEVTGYNNGRQAVVGPKVGSRLTVMFRDGQVSGSSGCNRFHGSFTAQGNALAIHPLATTRMACEEGLMAQEQEFLRALQSATTWKIVRGMLDVHRADGERVLTASPAGE